MTDQRIQYGNESVMSKWSSVLWGAVLGLMQLLVGVSRLNDLNTKGFYRDSKHGLSFDASEGMITVYALIISGSVFLGYSMVVAALKVYRSNEQTKRNG